MLTLICYAKLIIFILNYYSFVEHFFHFSSFFFFDAFFFNLTCKTVKVILQIVETMSFTDKVADFMDNVGPFYEMVELPLPKKKDSYNEEDQENSYNGDNPISKYLNVFHCYFFVSCVSCISSS